MKHLINFTDLTEINFAAVVINFLTLGIFFGFVSGIEQYTEIQSTDIRIIRNPNGLLLILF